MASVTSCSCLFFPVKKYPSDYLPDHPTNREPLPLCQISELYMLPLLHTKWWNHVFHVPVYVLPATYHFQVLKAIVSLDSVLVMHVLACQQSPAEGQFHD